MEWRTTRVDRRAFVRATIATIVLVGSLALAASTVGAQTLLRPDLVTDWGQYDDYPAGTDRVAQVRSPEEIYLDGGIRRIIRFDGYVTNIGEGPIRIQGNPQTDSVHQWILTDGGTFVRGRKVELVFENDDGHNHWHLKNAMTYSLWTEDRSRQVTRGAKVGFCLYDINRINDRGPASPVYTGAVVNWCDTGNPGSTDVEMGTSGGWSDIYTYSISQQWVDISEVAPGRYRLAARPDADDQIEESNERNNGVGFHPDPIVIPGYSPTDTAASTTGTEPVQLRLDFETFGAPGRARFEIVRRPSHGTVTVDAGTGRATYTANPGFVGLDEFEFTVYDRDDRYPLSKPAATASVDVDAPPAGAFANGGFESPRSTATWTRLDGPSVGRWSTGSGAFDLWRTGYAGAAHQGDQYVELNTFAEDSLFQDFDTTPGETLRWSFAHRGHVDEDTVQLAMGRPGGTMTSQGVFTSLPGGWTTYSGVYTVPAGQTVTRIRFTARDAGSEGNFLDSVTISRG